MADVKGSFRVNRVRMWGSNIQYALLFLKDRMIFVKVGGQFADGGLASAIVGGALGGVVGGAIAQALAARLGKSAARKKEQRIRSLSDMSVEELVGLDKNNFQLLYGEILGMKMKKSSMGLNGTRTGVLSIQGMTKESFDIAPNQKYEDCERVVLSLLPDKLTR